MAVSSLGADWRGAFLALIVLFLVAGEAAGHEAGPLPLESWDDDWVYPEGRIKIGGMRYSLVVGAIVTRWTSAATRQAFSAGQIDPIVDLYRPEPKGLSPSLDLTWTGLLEEGPEARIFAPTAGVRRVFAPPAARKLLVPFTALRAGPYFVNATGLGRHTVFGVNATLGVEIHRQVTLEARYDALGKVDGRSFSNWSATVGFNVPLGTPPRAEQKRRGTLPPPGEMVDVGGHRLHLVCRGEGSPAVVLDAGLSDSWAIWTRVQPALARTTRVCSYDRAGIGYSEPGPGPRTSGRIVDELHALLQNGGVPAPYVLVGHSFGGYNVRLYASRYPGEVAGLVLVDASHEDQWSRYPAEMRGTVEKAGDDLRAMAERAERGETVPPLAANLPPAIATRPSWYRALFDEFRSIEESAAELRAVDRSLAVPLVVVSAGRQRPEGQSQETREEMRRLWDEMQAELSALSPRGRRVVARKSGHYVQREAPGLVRDAILDVVAQARR